MQPVFGLVLATVVAQFTVAAQSTDGYINGVAFGGLFVMETSWMFDQVRVGSLRSHLAGHGALVCQL